MAAKKRLSSGAKKVPVISAASKSRVACPDHGFGKKIILTLFGVFLVYLIFFLGTATRNYLKEYNYIGKADKSERFITVNGTGKATASNNIAMTTLGYSNVSEDVSEAQAANDKVMSQVLKQLSELGIADEDLKSNYTIYPEYRYTSEEGSVLIGYRVNHTVAIKIRDLNLVNDVLALAGQFDVNQISGLEFTVSDETEVKDRSREEALKDAAKKLRYLSDVLGVEIGKVVSYNEYFSGDDSYIKYGLGAGGELGGPGVAPATGSEEMVANVNITYELL